MTEQTDQSDDSPINLLHDKLLIEIFNYFEAEKLLQISRVCRRFRRVALDFQVLKEIKFEGPVPEDALELVLQSTRECRSIIFGLNQKMNLETLQNSRDHLRSIRSIQFNQSQLTGEFLNEMPTLFPALTSLSCFLCQIHQINGELGQLHRLVYLRYLDLKSTPIRDEELLNFMNGLPSGQLLSLKFLLHDEAYVHH